MYDVLNIMKLERFDGQSDTNAPSSNAINAEENHHRMDTVKAEQKKENMK
jgi:hypothetical protein